MKGSKEEAVAEEAMRAASVQEVVTQTHLMAQAQAAAAARQLDSTLAKVTRSNPRRRQPPPRMNRGVQANAAQPCAMGLEHGSQIWMSLFSPLIRFWGVPPPR